MDRDALASNYSTEDLVEERKLQLRRIEARRKRDVLVIAADLRNKLSS